MIERFINELNKKIETENENKKQTVSIYMDTLNKIKEYIDKINNLIESDFKENYNLVFNLIFEIEDNIKINLDELTKGKIVDAVKTGDKKVLQDLFNAYNQELGKRYANINNRINLIEISKDYFEEIVDYFDFEKKELKKIINSEFIFKKICNFLNYQIKYNDIFTVDEKNAILNEIISQNFKLIRDRDEKLRTSKAKLMKKQNSERIRKAAGKTKIEPVVIIETLTSPEMTEEQVKILKEAEKILHDNEELLGMLCSKDIEDTLDLIEKENNHYYDLIEDKEDKVLLILHDIERIYADAKESGNKETFDLLKYALNKFGAAKKVLEEEISQISKFESDNSELLSNIDVLLKELSEIDQTIINLIINYNDSAKEIINTDDKNSFIESICKNIGIDVFTYEKILILNEIKDYYDVYKESSLIEEKEEWIESLKEAIAKYNELKKLEEETNLENASINGEINSMPDKNVFVYATNNGELLLESYIKGDDKEYSTRIDEMFKKIELMKKVDSNSLFRNDEDILAKRNKSSGCRRHSAGEFRIAYKRLNNQELGIDKPTYLILIVGLKDGEHDLYDYVNQKAIQKCIESIESELSSVEDIDLYLSENESLFNDAKERLINQYDKSEGRKM